MAKTIYIQRLTLLFLVWVWGGSLGAQNLVPNPGFELFTACPNFPLFSFCQSWTVPSNHMGSPDYFNTCAVGAANVPSNYMGYQWPASGNAYGGILIKNSSPNFREYMQAQFTAPLTAGETYYVSLKCAWGLTGTSPFGNITTDGIGIYISQTAVNFTGLGTNPIPVTPQYNPTVTLDSANWTEIGFYYPASGGETYLLIGNYKDDIATTLTPVAGAYIYIDDVSVHSTDETFVAGDTLLCLGDTSTLTAYNGGTYAWANAAAPNILIENGPALTLSPTVTTTYYVYTASDTDTVTVHVFPNPNVNAGPDITVCPQQPVTLGVTGAPNYAWSNGATAGTPFFPPMTTTEYVVTGTDINGCQDTDTVRVTVQQTGCPNFPNTHNCDVDAIRQAFTAAGCIEMSGCVGDCSLYYLNPQPMTGTQAQTFAQSFGANLASIASIAEDTCISNALIALSSYNPIWIGLNDGQTEGNFVWYDQSPVTYLNWSGLPTQQPDNEILFDINGEDCVQLYPGIGWFDRPCSNNAPSVIEVSLCPVVNAGPDITVCGGSAPLQASNVFGSSPYTYLWSNGAQTQGTSVSPATSPANYWVSSQDRYDCVSSDTVKVTTDGLLVINLGPDTVICQADNLLLVAYQGGAHIAGTQYLWHNGNTTPFFTPTQSGTYWVNATLNGCMTSDTIQVTINPNPTVNLGADGVLCQGQTLTLDAGVPNADYLWQDNATTPTYTVQQGGTYSVTVSVANCTATDAVTFTEQPAPTVNLGNDATLCSGTPFTLDATTPNAGYLWQNGSTGATFSPTASGVYWVEVAVNGCTARDSVQLLFLPQPSVNLGNDTLLCLGSTLLLDATAPGLSYQWDDGSAAATYSVSQTGTYSVQVTDGNGCQNTDVIAVTYITAPQFSFMDSTLCKGDTWALDITAPAAVYLWQDKSVLPTYTIHGEGTYWAMATNPCGSASDTTTVEYRSCECYLYIPNSFTPNDDDRNERFLVQPNTECQLEQYTFSLFNRWGQLVFETANVEFLWDGTANGRSLPVDVYVYRVAYKFDKGPQTYKWGHISLVR